jgi:hypothetical protein
MRGGGKDIRRQGEKEKQAIRRQGEKEEQAIEDEAGNNREEARAS